MTVSASASAPVPACPRRSAAPRSVIALVDGNNFYASCERVFRPALAGRPVIVLSNNDGCAIARSNEAKALGVRMGQPWHECRHLQASAGLVALSANFALYGDMSDRMMAIAASTAPRQEIYSIDECFLDLGGVPGDLVDRCRNLRERVLRWVGIPTCVGLGPTKTLAKLANHVAKTAERNPGSYPAELAGVCDLGRLPAPALEAVLAATPVGEVWGVGRRLDAALQAQGILTALDLARADAAALRARHSVVLEKTVRELQGIRCMDLEDQPAPRQQIMVSRSFGAPVQTLAEMEEAVSVFAARAAEKLRRDAQLAGSLGVFLRTSPFRAGDRQHSASCMRPLASATDDSRRLVDAAVQGIRGIWLPGHRYAKAGVMLLELQPAGEGGCSLQGELALEGDSGRVSNGSSALMGALDAINRRYGSHAVAVGAAPPGASPRRWAMRQERLTPQYTTRWADRPVVRAC